MQKNNKHVERQLRRRLYDLMTRQSPTTSTLVSNWKALPPVELYAKQADKFAPIVEDAARTAHIGWLQGITGRQPRSVAISPEYNHATRWLLNHALKWGHRIAQEQMIKANGWRTSNAPIPTATRIAAAKQY